MFIFLGLSSAEFITLIVEHPITQCSSVWAVEPCFKGAIKHMDNYIHAFTSGKLHQGGSSSSPRVCSHTIQSVKYFIFLTIFWDFHAMVISLF